MQTLYILIFLYQRTAQIAQISNGEALRHFQLKPMTARHKSCTSQRDHDEANEIVQRNKRPIPFLTQMNGFPSRGSPVNTNTNVTVSLRDEFNRNKETETSKNERIPKTDGRSMKYRNTGNGIIRTFVKLSF